VISLVGASLVDLWTFVALHGAFGLIGFMLRQFEIASSSKITSI
jgi:hypothetical protein